MKLAEMLREVFGAVSREIAARRAELLAPELRPGETMPDAELEHELYLRLLDRRLEAAVKAEQGYRREGIQQKVLSRQRDQATADLTRLLGGLRQVIDLARGKGASARLLAIKGRTERRQLGVYFQAGHALARLGGLIDLGLESTDPAQAGVSSDPVVWRGMIEPAYRRLEDLRKFVTRQEKILDGLLIAKRKAFELFDDTARSLIRIAEGQCLLVGRHDLAERVRRFSRKRRRPGPKPKKSKKAKKGKKAKSKKAKSKKTVVEELAQKRRSLASARVA